MKSLDKEISVLGEAISLHNADEPSRALANAPFYALGPAKSYIVPTDGGLAVNEDLALIGHGDRAIPGLWTAGSAGQGGLILKGHGHHIGWAFTSGRIAGRNAAAAAIGKA